MRLVFESEDDVGFYATRDELVECFERWIVAQRLAPPGDAATNLAENAGVALDWKWGYRDGRLARWHRADVAAMGDPTKFGLAKSIVSAATSDGRPNAMHE